MHYGYIWLLTSEHIPNSRIDGIPLSYSFIFSILLYLFGVGVGGGFEVRVPKC